MPSAFERWLEGVGLAKYAKLFSENGIDLDIVGELEDADLKDLGISLGDRKRMLKAISALSADAPAPDASSESSLPIHPPAESSTLVSATEAQRRQLTVMFCDLVGSTALSRRLDPEDLREAVSVYQHLCSGIVARLSGFVAQFLGDGILVYFGWPRAHENDAERAVRAGLGVVEAMQGLDAPRVGGEALSVRIGIATGPVVVGNLLSSGSNNEATATGETPNLAARLQECASANGIVIAPSTYALAGALFECVNLGERQFKGFQAPMSVWQVVRERPAESRFEAVRADRLAPFVGREQEVGLILERWQEAKTGEGQVVLLSGEAGIGKSRIAQTLRERIASEPHTRLRYQCSPYYTSTAFYPFVTQLERAAGFALDDSAEAKLDKVEAMVAAVDADTKEAASLLAALLTIPAGDRYPPLDMPAPQLKARIIATLTEQLARLTAKQPVLLIFEDAHWADPTSLEVLDQTLGLMSSLPVLAVITTRPEFENRWTQHAHVTLLTLNRLSRPQSGVLVEGVTGGKKLPRDVLDQIIAKTDGVPLFVEELTRTVLESGLLAERSNQYELTGPLPPLAIPTTLQDSLMARLDRLDAVKELAQIGAAIGREFPYKLLAAVAPVRGTELDSGLERLVASGLVFRQGSANTARYVFKHALVQDAAYGSLLKSRRQVLHQKIVRALDDNFSDVVEATPEILAHHYTEAGLTEQAIEYWQKAGQIALKRSANREAISHLNRALQLLMRQPASESRDKLELALRSRLVPALVITQGMAAAETEINIKRAATLAEAQGAISEHLAVLYGHWLTTGTRGNALEALDFARRIAEQAARLPAQEDNRRVRMIAHRLVGFSMVWLGRFAAAREELEHCDALYDAQRDASLRFVYGVDVRAATYCYFGIEKAIRGYPEEGASFSDRALELARTLDHVGTLTWCLASGSIPPHIYSIATLEARGRELLNLATTHDLRQWVPVARILIAYAHARSGKYAEAFLSFNESSQLLRTVRLKTAVTAFIAPFAEWYCEIGDAQAGINLLNEAQEIIDGGGERWYEAEVWRVRGRLCHLATDDVAAEEAYLKALEVARSQEAKSWELNAARDLATLWKEQGKVAEARDLLAPIYDWFTEGFDTDDLKSSKALLDELELRALS